jgi:hypothetical protein
MKAARTKIQPTTIHLVRLLGMCLEAGYKVMW